MRVDGRNPDHALALLQRLVQTENPTRHGNYGEFVKVPFHFDNGCCFSVIIVSVDIVTFCLLVSPGSSSKLMCDTIITIKVTLVAAAQLLPLWSGHSGGPATLCWLTPLRRCPFLHNYNLG